MLRAALVRARVGGRVADKHKGTATLSAMPWIGKAVAAATTTDDGETQKRKYLSSAAREAFHMC